MYNGPSGHAEPQYVWNKNITREVLRDGIVREIVEEVGIPEKALSEPRLIGVMRDADSKPDCLFVVETTQTSSEVKEGYRHALEAWESERLAFVDSEDCGLALTPVTRAAFACLGLLFIAERVDGQHWRDLANNGIEGRALLLPAVVLDEGVPGAARPAEFVGLAG